MDLKSFFDLEKVVFSKEKLKTPYEDEPTSVIFIRNSNPHKDKSTNFTFNKNNQ